MLYSTEAIVLKAIRYADTKAIVHTYTKDFGSVSYWIPVSTGNSMKKFRVMLRPLSLLELDTDHRSSLEIQRVKEVRIRYLPKSPSTDPISNAIALFLAEVWDHILRKEQPERSLFEFLEKTLVGLDDAPLPFLASYHLFHLSHLTSFLGIMPDASTYRERYGLDVTSGKFVPTKELLQKTDHIEESSATLYSLLTSETPEKLPLTREERNNLLALLLLYYEKSYPSLSTLKSPEVLQTLF